LATARHSRTSVDGKNAPAVLFGLILTNDSHFFRRLTSIIIRRDPELFMGWVDPWVGLCWVGSTTAKVLKI